MVTWYILMGPIYVLRYRFMHFYLLMQNKKKDLFGFHHPLFFNSTGNYTSVPSCNILVPLIVVSICIRNYTVELIQCK